MTKPRNCPAPVQRASQLAIEEVGERMGAFALNDHRYGMLFDLLLEAGGVGVAAIEEPDLAQLLERGYLRSGIGVRKARGMPISCHENAARLWAMNPGETVIVTGWALSKKDGLWRQHSWARDSADDRLYETTTKRAAYFGFDLTPDESQKFYDGNVLHLRAQE